MVVKIFYICSYISKCNGLTTLAKTEPKLVKRVLRNCIKKKQQQRIIVTCGTKLQASLIIRHATKKITTFFKSLPSSGIIIFS